MLVLNRLLTQGGISRNEVDKYLEKAPRNMARLIQERPVVVLAGNGYGMWWGEALDSRPAAGVSARRGGGELERPRTTSKWGLGLLALRNVRGKAAPYRFTNTRASRCHVAH